MLKRVTGFLARSRSWTAALKTERSVCTTSRTVPGERVCERSGHPRLYLRCADGREPPTAESGSGNVVVDHGFDPSRGGRAMRTGCGPLLRVLGNGYWILVVDVAPVKLLCSTSLILFSASVRRLKILEHSRPSRSTQRA